MQCIIKDLEVAKMKRMITAILAALLSMSLLAGCGKGEFSVGISEDNTAAIEAINAKAGSEGAAGTLTVEENQKIVIIPNFEGDGAVTIQLKSFELGESAESEELLSALNAEGAVFDETITGTEPVEYEVPAGDYMVFATAQNKVTGTATVTLERAE